MIESPASIEFATLESRHPYASYPPGSTLPIYVLARVLGQEPNPRMVMGYNLATHCLIAWLLGATAYVVLVRGRNSALERAAVCRGVSVRRAAFPARRRSIFIRTSTPWTWRCFSLCVLCLLLESLRPVVSNHRLWRLLEGRSSGACSSWAT